MPSRRANDGPSAEARMASVTCGMNIAPYCVPLRLNPRAGEDRTGGREGDQSQTLHDGGR